MRQFAADAPAGKRYFDGACEAMKRVGPGEFLITPGDFDPPAPVRAVIDRYLGPSFPWYVVIGNHEVETPEDMAWVKQWAAPGIPHVVRTGPPGKEYAAYSFDIGNSHFVALDDYPAGKPGAPGKDGLDDAGLDWLEKDLAATRQPLRWVIGHKPVQSLPDMDSGRVRHGEESVSSDPARIERFVALLKTYRVRAYVCGHTHDTSVARVRGVWQADSGHARGGGDPGAPSSFLKFRIVGEQAWVDIYRADPDGREYKLRQTVALE